MHNFLVKYAIWISNVNEPLPLPLLYWYATSGAGGLRSGNQLILGNAKQYNDMKFHHNSRYGLGRTDLFPDFCGDVLYDVPGTHVDKFIFFQTLDILFFFISAHLSIKHHSFRNLLTLNNYRYQTCKRHIMKFYLLIPKHLIIQLVKLQIDILKLYTTFWHCKKKKKKSDYFWTRVYVQIFYPHTDPYKHFFLCCTIPEWNSIPARAVKATSVESFKIHLAGRPQRDQPWSGTPTHPWYTPEEDWGLPYQTRPVIQNWEKSCLQPQLTEVESVHLLPLFEFILGSFAP